MNYDSFNLIELIDELKTRFDCNFRVEMTLHGMMLSLKDGCNYTSLRGLLIEWLENDDKKRKYDR